MIQKDWVMIGRDIQNAVYKFKYPKSEIMHESKKENFRKDGFMAESKVAPTILPSPAILESYEEIMPGSVKQLLDAAKSEQLHRQKMENISARFLYIKMLFLCSVIITVIVLMAINQYYLYASTIIFAVALLALYKLNFQTIKINEEKKNNTTINNTPKHTHYKRKYYSKKRYVSKEK